MLPNYVIYEAQEDIPSVRAKKGTQFISVQTSPFNYGIICYCETSGELLLSVLTELTASKRVAPIGTKGNALPLSQVHPSILEFYKEQIGLHRHFTKNDVREIKDLFGTQYISDSISMMSSTLHSISEVLSETTIIPTIVGSKWNDFIISLNNLDQLGLVPAIVHKLSKVTLISLDEVNSIDIDITNSYHLYFNIVSKVGNIIILELGGIQPY